MLLWALAGVMLLPMRYRRDLSVTVVIRGQGEALWLERQIRGFLWLRESGVLWWDVLILDVGLTENARDRARRLERMYDQVRYLPSDDGKE